MFKKIIFFIIIFLVGLLLFLYFHVFTQNSNQNQDQKVILNNQHFGKKISNVLNNENYAKVGINSEDYNSFESFLEDFKTFSGVLIDPLNEKFVAGVNSGSGVTFIPFDFKTNSQLFDNNTNKNLAILDIYSAYKDNKIYGSVDSEYKNQILFDKDMEHPLTNELNKIFDVDLFSNGNNVYNIINSLNKTEDIGVGNTELLAYLYDFTGEYSKALSKRESICEKYGVDCNDNIKVTVYGKVEDSNGKPVVGAEVKLLNNSISTITNSDGSYSLAFESFPFSHLRFKSTLNLYSDGFSTISLNNTYSKDLSFESNFKVQKYDNIFTINNQNISDYKKGKYFIIETDYSKYFIPINGLYYSSSGKYKDLDFTVYTYLFKKSSNMESMLENDTFEPVYGYVGNIMKTFGMPYIQLIDNKTGEELYVKSSNPIILQNQVYHMQELYDNYDGIYEAVTDEDMQFLVQKSEELGGYPIDFDFLTSNGLLRWPARWVLDREKGIWSNIGSRVINTAGLMELPFYHIKDN